MKMINFLIITFLLLNHLGISQPVDEKAIKLKCDFANTGPVKMSEIISEIKYISLETNPNCLIGNMNIPVFGKDIIIRSFTGSVNGADGIYRFSDKGQFLNKIGNIGRGPGEYQDYTDVVQVGDTVFIVSNFSNDIFCYSIAGNFLKKYHIDMQSRPKSLVELPDKSFMIAFSNPGDIGILLRTDKSFNFKKGYKINVPFKNNPLPFGFKKSTNKVLFYYNYLDTIFDVSKGYPIPSIIIDYGKYRTAREKLSMDENNNAVLNKPSIIDFSASDEYLSLYVYYPFSRSTYNILYRITDGKQFIWTNLINNLDNGVLERWPGFLFENNLVFHLLPSTILKRFENMTKAEKLDPINSGFVNMASKITLESNPVIMICKLKKSN